jgi:hypothetical protein
MNGRLWHFLANFDGGNFVGHGIAFVGKIMR